MVGMATSSWPVSHPPPPAGTPPASLPCGRLLPVGLPGVFLGLYLAMASKMAAAARGRKNGRWRWALRPGPATAAHGRRAAFRLNRLHNRQPPWETMR